jgi:hypothetical protein
MAPYLRKYSGHQSMHGVVGPLPVVDPFGYHVFKCTIFHLV